jgi:hypothetical protein
LSSRSFTLGAEELVALAGTLGDSFAEAAEKVLPRMANLRTSESTVERTTEDAGARLGALLDEEHTLGPNKHWEWHKDINGRSCAYISIDALNVPQQGPNGSAAPSRMPYVSMVYNPEPDLKAAAEMIAHQQGADSPAAKQAEAKVEAGKAKSAKGGAAKKKKKKKKMEVRYLAGLYALTQLGMLLRAQAGQVGMDDAEQWIGLSDGGAGLEDFQQKNFNRANLVLILDFHHPAEDLEELAKLENPGNEEAAKEQAEKWCHTMKHQGGQAIVDELRERGPPERFEARERYEEILGFFGNNVPRMNYPYYIAQGWQIGSGPVESACKTVVTARMKLAGMRWGEQGTDVVCHLRALFKSEKDQWQAFWSRSVN